MSESNDGFFEKSKSASLIIQIGLILLIPTGCQTTLKSKTNAPAPALFALNELNISTIQKIHSERRPPNSDDITRMRILAKIDPRPTSEMSNQEERRSAERARPTDIQKMSLNEALRYFRGESLKDLLSASQNLPTQSCDYNPNAAYAVGSHLERYLPNESAKSSSLTSYEYSIRCAQGETLEQSRYRYALLSLAFENSCEKSTPALKALADTPGLRPAIQIRSQFWLNHCSQLLPSELASTATPETTRQAIPLNDLSLLNEFPLSHHALLMTGLLKNSFFGESTAITTTESQSSQVNTTQVLYPTGLVYTNPFSTDRELNDWLWVIEKTYLANEIRDLKKLLYAFSQTNMIQQINKSSSEGLADVLVYASHFAYTTQEHLPLFQLLSKAIVLKPSLRNQEIYTRFFPLAFDQEIQRAAQEFGVEVNLIRALIRQESAFNPFAHSTAGARGLMQLMPDTARRLDRRMTRQRLFNPADNIRIGTLYLSRLIDRFGGDYRLALAAYNAGTLKVENWIRRYPTANVQLLVDLFPYRETREYVASIERNRFWYSQLYPISPSTPEILTPVGNSQSESETKTRRKISNSFPQITIQK